MTRTKRILILCVCVSLLATGAMATSLKVTRLTSIAQLKARIQSLRAAAGSTPVTPDRSLFHPKMAKAPRSKPPVIWTAPQYKASLLTSGFPEPAGIGVGTLGDWVLVNSYDFGDLYGLKNGEAKYLGTPSSSLAGGKMWGHYYFGDEYGNFFRLESDLTITPVFTEIDEYGIEVGAVAIDHVTGHVYFAYNIFLAPFPLFFILDYNPATGDLNEIAEFSYEFCSGMGIKGNYLYLSLPFDDEIIKYNKKGTIPPTTFVDGIDVPADMEFDAAGNLFVAELEGGNIVFIKSGTTRLKRIATGFEGPVCLGLDKAGDVFFDTEVGEVWKLIKLH